DPCEQRVVGAAKYQGVDTGVAHRFQVLAGDPLELRTVGHALLDELDEARACLGGDLQMRRCSERVLVRLRQNGCPGADDAYMTVAGGRDSTAHRRLNHLDDGNPGG